MRAAAKAGMILTVVLAAFFCVFTAVCEPAFADPGDTGQTEDGWIYEESRSAEFVIPFTYHNLT